MEPINMLVLNEISEALDKLPEYVTYVRVWTDDAAAGGPGQRIDFKWKDEAWHLLEWSGS